MGDKGKKAQDKKQKQKIKKDEDMARKKKEKNEKPSLIFHPSN